MTNDFLIRNNIRNNNNNTRRLARNEESTQLSGRFHHCRCGASSRTTTAAGKGGIPPSKFRSQTQNGMTKIPRKTKRTVYQMSLRYRCSVSASSRSPVADVAGMHVTCSSNETALAGTAVVTVVANGRLLLLLVCDDASSSSCHSSFRLQLSAADTAVSTSSCSRIRLSIKYFFFSKVLMLDLFLFCDACVSRSSKLLAVGWICDGNLLRVCFYGLCLGRINKYRY